MFLSRIQNLFTKEKIPFAVVGGYAVAIHGVARGTFDVDIITEISEENFLKIESALKSIGMNSLLPVGAKDLFLNLGTYQKEKHLVAWNFVNPKRFRDCLDIIITEDVRNYKTFFAETDFGPLSVISLDGLIQMKSKTGRLQDVEDVQALKRLNS
ncbi:hypothetical protein [Leptospira ilyithenensis]|uniref:Nucleotidyltransferase family protein n=1 Tax=Leptospira ilyithenensis TaxID=2484901 RepID=A0A4R9LPQ9_9LEPT|nr:hypothetical protein [Leptospira ilyithenensis]TGN09372.1 hypothetical protein EHS11_12550 [Leptospira ilyithenensis]